MAISDDEDLDTARRRRREEARQRHFEEFKRRREARSSGTVSAAVGGRAGGNSAVVGGESGAGIGVALAVYGRDGVGGNDEGKANDDGIVAGGKQCKNSGVPSSPSSTCSSPILLDSDDDDDDCIPPDTATYPATKSSSFTTTAVKFANSSTTKKALSSAFSSKALPRNSGISCEEKDSQSKKRSLDSIRNLENDSHDNDGNYGDSATKASVSESLSSHPKVPSFSTTQNQQTNEPSETLEHSTIPIADEKSNDKTCYSNSNIDCASKQTQNASQNNQKRRRKFQWMDSDSDSDDDTKERAEMLRRLAERNRTRGISAPAIASTPKLATKTSLDVVSNKNKSLSKSYEGKTLVMNERPTFQWSDSDSDDEISKRLAKRKQTDVTTKDSSDKRGIVDSSDGNGARSKKEATPNTNQSEDDVKLSYTSPIHQQKSPPQFSFPDGKSLSMSSPNVSNKTSRKHNTLPLSPVGAKSPSSLATSANKKPKKQATLQSLFVQDASKSPPKEQCSSQSCSNNAMKIQAEQPLKHVTPKSISSFLSTNANQSYLPTLFTTTSTAPSPPKISSDDDVNNTDPIVATLEKTPLNAKWTVQKQCLIVRSVLPTKRHHGNDASPREKVAGFDLDQTLVQWRCSGWPSRPEHYELWNCGVVEKLRQMHDEENYKLVIFSNQGGIRGAFNGKTATRIKGIIDWIAKLVDRPVFAVCSTKKDGGYHKGDPGMWNIMKEYCNGGIKVHPDLSFFVGDSDGSGVDSADPQQQQYQQLGVDRLFAENVGMKFYTPGEFFGKSNADKRRDMAMVQPPPPLPREAINTHAALLGGYLRGPILLILCGVQGSGKTTFSLSLLNGSNDAWCHFSQDTIRNGLPGKREDVETAAREALLRGKSVVIDRMHLDPEQRSHFVKVGKECNVPVHTLVMMASEEQVHERVKNRLNHPGKVEGVNGARIAVASLSRMKLPKYEEGFALISYTFQIEGEVLDLYRRVLDRDGKYMPSTETNVPIKKSIQLNNDGKDVAFPMLTFGTMGLGKNSTSPIVEQAIKMGFESIDTAPTYKNEGEIGSVLNSLPSNAAANNFKVTIKIPKRVTNASQARAEVVQSLSLLKRKYADVILIHWPCDLIETGALPQVWKELESMKREGLCLIIGVANFSISALEHLLPCCTIKPAINQVERHPLLPQYDLIAYCSSQGLVVFAHSVLGHGSAMLLENEIILRISKENQISPAQVLLCWNLQQGVPSIAKFSSGKHGKELIALIQEDTYGESIHKLSPAQMEAIDGMSLGTDATPHRFVAPPFMFRPGASYSWGDKAKPNLQANALALNFGKT